MKLLPLRQTLTLLRPTLVPFSATYLAKPNLIYKNNVCRRSSEQILSNWAYQVPRARDRPELFLGKRKTFQAERYGGSGLLNNGGGARCGLRGAAQIKGIGPNPLVGEGTDYWYSNGAISLSDALKEAVWGELLPIVLPFGGVPILAVIATGTKCQKMGPLGKRVSTLRGLVVRENALRAGHFERATYFRPKPAFKMLRSRDVDRVRAMINNLPGALSLYETYDESENSSDLAGKTYTMLTRFANRVAEQLATSKAKRIMHGGLSSSNISVDGRWLDYGSISVLPGYTNTRNYDPPYWLEYTIVGEMFRSISFFCKKYLITPSGTSECFDDIDAYFCKQYFEHLHHQFGLLAGYPDIVVSGDRGKKLLLDLGQVLVELAQHGAEKPFRGEIKALRNYGTHRLGDILATSAQSLTNSDRERRINSLILDNFTRSKFISRANELAEFSEAEGNSLGIRKSSLRKLATLNATKSATELPGLFEPCLSANVSNLVAKNPDPETLSDEFRKFLSDVMDSAYVVFERPTSFKALCYKREGTHISYDAEANVWLEGEGRRCKALHNFPDVLSDSLAKCSSAFRYLGDI